LVSKQVNDCDLCPILFKCIYVLLKLRVLMDCSK
jgi:hypothetical protein